MGKMTIVLLGILGMLVPTTPVWADSMEPNSVPPVEVSIPVEPTEVESTDVAKPPTDREERAARIEKRVAKAFCRATESGVLVNTFVEQMEKSFAQQGARPEVQDLTIELVRELFGIGVEEACNASSVTK